MGVSPLFHEYVRPTSAIRPVLVLLAVFVGPPYVTLKFRAADVHHTVTCCCQNGLQTQIFPNLRNFPEPPTPGIFSGQVRPRQGQKSAISGHRLHWRLSTGFFCFFSSMYVQFSKTSTLKSGESSEKSSGENRAKSCHVCGCHGFLGPDFLKSIAGTNGRRTAAQMGGVLQYKLEVYCGVSLSPKL